MKKLTFLFVFASLIATAQVQTPQPSPASKLAQTVGLTDVEVKYSRPSMRGRKVFGNLVPFGKIWRTGANENTTITFNDDITINNDTLKKGTYAIYTKPNADKWEVIFYSDAKNWGNPRQWSDAKVALKAIVPVQKMPMPIETFTITLDDLKSDGATLGMLWENIYVGVPFNVPTKTKAEASIKKVMAGPSANDYFNAAKYYKDNGKDLNQALTWVDKAIASRPSAFWMVREKALILAKMGKKKEAIATAKKSIELAEKAGNAGYVKMNKASIADWSK